MWKLMCFFLNYLSELGLELGLDFRCFEFEVRVGELFRLGNVED